MTKKSRDRRVLNRKVKVGVYMPLGNYKELKPTPRLGLTQLTQEDIEKYRCKAYNYLLP